MLGVAAPLVLGRLGHLDHTPQAAAYLWLLAALGAVSAVVLAGLLLLVGSSHLVVDLAALLATCSMALRAALDTPTGTPGPLVGLALLTAATASCSRSPAAASPACPASPSLTTRPRWPTACPDG